MKTAKEKWKKQNWLFCRLAVRAEEPLTEIRSGRERHWERSGMHMMRTSADRELRLLIGPTHTDARGIIYTLAHVQIDRPESPGFH